jgi:hypothetical protein
MTYDCIPIWQKQREKDPFDYPLRTKKEVMFEHEIAPPVFNVTLKKRLYPLRFQQHGNALNNSDTRPARLSFIVDLDEMGLGPVQKQRMIFLLGRRYKNDNKLRLTVRQFNDLNYNYARGVDIIKQLYYEAKRAPDFLWHKMYNKERRYYKRKLVGKTPEEQEKKAKEVQEIIDKETAKFEELWKDQSNFTKEKRKERYEKIIESLEKKKGETNKEEEMKKYESSIPSKEEYYKGLVRDRVLTPKAYKTFFENELENQK